MNSVMRTFISVWPRISPVFQVKYFPIFDRFMLKKAKTHLMHKSYIIINIGLSIFLQSDCKEAITNCNCQN